MNKPAMFPSLCLWTPSGSSGILTMIHYSLAGIIRAQKLIFILQRKPCWEGFHPALKAGDKNLKQRQISQMLLNFLNHLALLQTWSRKSSNLNSWLELKKNSNILYNLFLNTFQFSSICSLVKKLMGTNIPVKKTLLAFLFTSWYNFTMIVL